MPGEKIGGLKQFDIAPIGAAGLDMHTAEAVLAPATLVESRHMRLYGSSARSRRGKRRLATLSNPQTTHGAYTFAAGKWIYAPYHASHNVPVGPWCLKATFTTPTPGANPSGHLGVMIAGRELSDGSNTRPFGFELKSDNTLYGFFTNDSGGAVVECHATVTNGATYDALLAWDPHTSGGKLSMFLDGDLADSEQGVGATARPKVSTGAVIMIGGTSNNGGVSLVADGAFTGAVDSVTLLSWPGRDMTTARSNGRSLLDTLRRWTRQDWPNPEEAIFHYGLDEESGTVAYDESDRMNHGTIVGAPTSGAALNYPFHGANYVGVLEKTSRERVLYVVTAGQTYRQVIRQAGA